VLEPPEDVTHELCTDLTLEREVDRSVVLQKRMLAAQKASRILLGFPNPQGVSPHFRQASNQFALGLIQAALFDFHAGKGGAWHNVIAKFRVPGRQSLRNTLDAAQGQPFFEELNELQGRSQGFVFPGNLQKTCGFN
jgi:hypothetical protein